MRAAAMNAPPAWDAASSDGRRRVRSRPADRATCRHRRARPKSGGRAASSPTAPPATSTSARRATRSADAFDQPGAPTHASPPPSAPTPRPAGTTSTPSVCAAHGGLQPRLGPVNPRVVRVRSTRTRAREANRRPPAPARRRRARRAPVVGDVAEPPQRERRAHRTEPRRDERAALGACEARRRQPAAVDLAAFERHVVGPTPASASARRTPTPVHDAEVEHVAAPKRDGANPRADHPAVRAPGRLRLARSKGRAAASTSVVAGRRGPRSASTLHATESARLRWRWRSRRAPDADAVVPVQPVPADARVARVVRTRLDRDAALDVAAGAQVDPAGHVAQSRARASRRPGTSRRRRAKRHRAQEAEAPRRPQPERRCPRDGDAEHFKDRVAQERSCGGATVAPVKRTASGVPRHGQKARFPSPSSSAPMGTRRSWRASLVR